MRTSLVRLRVRPASSLSIPNNDSTSPRRVGHKIEERAIGLRDKRQHEINPLIRKVRFEGIGAPAAWSKLEKARLKHEDQKKKERDLVQSREQHMTTTADDWEVASSELAQPERTIKLDRIRPQVSKNAVFRNVAPQDRSHNALDGPAVQQAKDVKEVDKWGKSVKIWFDLLQREARLKGDAGIKQVWTLIKEAEVDLPVESSIAGTFWSLLFRCEELHDDVVAYAIRQRVRTGKAYPPLYTMIMQYHLLKGETADILRWHRRLVDGYVIEPRALKALAPTVATSKDTNGLGAFHTIYSDLHGECEPCYDAFIPALLHAGRHREALLWHNILEKNNDEPSHKVANSEMIRVFQRLQQDVSGKRGARWRRLRQVQFRRALRKSTMVTTATVEAASATATFTPLLPDSTLQPVQTEAPSQAIEPRTRKDDFFTTLNTMLARNSVQRVRASPKSTVLVSPPPSSSKGGLISSLFAEVRNAGPNGFSDDFCARLYATHALTPAWVSSFIHAFSVKKIGPLALRELALRAESTEDLEHYLKDLNSKGVSIGASKFSLAVKKLAELGNAVLLGQVLSSDQHPDTLDDRHLQREMLDLALEQGNSAAIHRTATLLSMFAEEPEQEYSNVLLRSHIRKRQIPSMLKLADSMQAQKLKITAETVTLATSKLLRPRLTGKRPDALAKGFDYDDIRIVTNIVLRAAEGGTEVNERIWIELFKRHGMKDLGSLERFCHAGINCYGSIKVTAAYNERARITGSISLMLSAKPALNVEAQPEAPTTKLASPMHRLLDARRLQNIVSWGFMEGLRRLIAARDKQLRYSPHLHGKLELTRFRRWPADLTVPRPTQTFLCGLSVLQSLHEKGIRIQVSAIELVLEQRLWTLYGAGRSRKHGNNTAAALNPYGLLEIIRAVNQIWNGPPLFSSVRELLQPLTLEELQRTLSASQSGSVLDPRVHSSNSQDDFGTELPTDELSDFVPVTAREQPHKADQIREVADIRITSFIARNVQPPRDPHELQLLRYTRALMMIFYTRKTVGMGTAEEMRAQRAELSQEKWLGLLYAWARRQVHD